jgi:tRNA 5-methylaminomethyl-2-thiouridine biosynthesis bifunctional protein
MPRLPPEPSLRWDADGAPVAAAFDDVYFSKSGGLAEAEAVFVAGAGLPEGWRGRDRFALCELGFGTGLNVLAACRAWKKTQSAHAQLHISTIEAFPLERADAARALAAFPEVAEFSARLLVQWPVRAFGPQRVWLGPNISLTVWIGEVAGVLSGLTGAFDAWFLDGFAPARNPAMWSAEVFEQVRRLSAPGARLATFTVAGAVRRGLETVGFKVEKRTGFGGKRERLEARLTEVSGPSPAAQTATLPMPYAARHPRRVAVVGGGIAGAACAEALTRRGAEVVVLDAAPALGAGASGNPAGIVMPRIDRAGALSEVFLAAYLYAVARYAVMGADVFAACGVLQKPRASDAEAIEDLLSDPPLPSDWFARHAAGAVHGRAGVLRPRAAVEQMLSGAKVLYESQVGALEQADDGGWLALAPDGRARVKADAVILACGAALSRFAPARFIPIELSRGQIEWGPGAAPAHAVTSGSYVAPFDGGVLFGATFDGVNSADDAREDAGSRSRNVEQLRALAPEIGASLDEARLDSRASVRAATPDRAPVVGLLPDAEAWLATYAALAHGAPIDAAGVAPAHQGVYVLGGLGARGLTLAPLMGERLASELCGEPQTLSRAALEAIHPARFLERSLRRRRQPTRR